MMPNARAKFTPSYEDLYTETMAQLTGTKNLWDIIPGILRATAP